MKLFVYVIILLLLAFLVWPYSVIFRLDQALQDDDRPSIERLVDIGSIRLQIKRKMNKEVETTIGNVSNSFVDWLQNGIQHLGSDAIERMVNIDWALAQLRSHNPNPQQGGFIDHLSYAFFDGPGSLLLRIGELDDSPVHARLTFQDLEWRITAIYN
jgi:hypothetical protein